MDCVLPAPALSTTGNRKEHSATSGHDGEAGVERLNQMIFNVLYDPGPRRKADR